VLRVRAGLISAAAALRPLGSGPSVEREVADDLDALALSTAMWSVEAQGFDALEAGVRRPYERGRRALDELGPHPDAAQLHELRKRVKDHWYHLRLLREVWPPVMQALAVEARDLAEALGDDHDLAVLRAVLRSEDPDLLGTDRKAVLAAIDERRAELLVGIRAGARRVYADKPTTFTRRLRTWWEVAPVA
jgi:CHAD domain-containing protein